MSEIVQVKTINYKSKDVWYVGNAKDWETNLVGCGSTIKSKDISFDGCPNVKWHSRITRSGDDLTFSVNLVRLMTELENRDKYEYKISALLSRGKHNACWFFWQSEAKEKLKKIAVFSNPMGDIPTIQRNLDGDEIEARVTVELFRTTPVTETKQPVTITTSKLQVIDSLNNLLCTGNHSDVLVTAGGKEYKLHKAILSARSSVFAEYFKSHPDATTYKADKDVISKAFDVLVKFMYTAECANIDNVRNLLKIFAVADKYAVKDLKEIYECKLETLVTHSNAIEMFCQAIKYNSEFGLKRRAFQIIRDNYKKIGVNIPEELQRKSLTHVQEFIDAEMRMLELDLEAMTTNEE